ncbi:hypothetical protein ACFPVX_08175 [Cohnella faecalis]|uniref:DUF975 family protein n=1 Tax=Cohnella faecalis TaxID=2315694 RepID=A0A398CMG5_9BACL|nr:hypothetical protein [Cohnella faecalis]RIE01077.1 hypothetical protein D3H35_21885 [Cohnella faecalis]
MGGTLRKGWDMTVRHKYVLVLFFLYRLLWGFFIYRFIDSVVTPILSRYPNEHPNAGAAELFAIEAQFRLLRTDLIDETLWTLGGMILTRMLLTPLLNAGLYYSFNHSADGQGTRMLTGMRRAWKPIVVLYLAETFLLLLPAVWLLPMAKDRFFSNGSMQEWIFGLLPYFAGWILWGFLLHLAFQFMQFGAVAGESVWKGLLGAVRKALPLTIVTLLLAAFGLLASAAASSISILWSGFLAVVLHQAFHFIRSMLSVWTAASQFEIWRES